MKVTPNIYLISKGAICRIDEVRLDLINWDQILQLECVHAIQLICTYFGQFQHDEPENVKMHNTHHNY